MEFNFSDNSRAVGEPFASTEDLGFGDYAADIAMSPIRGIAGAAEGVYDLMDWVMFDWLPDAEDNFGLGHSRTLVGGLAEGITQFMVGFATPGVGGLSIASKLGKVSGLAKTATKFERAHRMAGHTKRAKALKWGKTFSRDITAGAVADFSVFDAQEERLSNLLQQFPALQNPVSEFLASDPNDSEVEGRLKNLLEGGMLGGMMEPFLMALRGMQAARKAKVAGQDPDAAARSAQRKEKIRSISTALGVDEERAAGVYGLARSILGDGADDIEWARGGEGTGSTTLRQMPDGSTVETLQLGTFFSQMDQVLKGAQQRKWESDSLRSYLKKNGVKDEELYWSGMDDYLKANPKVDLDEAAEAVQGIRIEEVIKGNSQFVVRESKNGRHYEVVDRETGEVVNTYFSRADAERVAHSRSSTEGGPQYEYMTLPGGEDYRELLITLPSKEPPNARYVLKDNEPLNLVPAGLNRPIDATTREFSGREEAIAAAGGDASRVLRIMDGPDPVNYQSSHWHGTTNVLAHVRFNTRQGINGEKVLFIEEIQSDWHQRGRKEGYQPRPQTFEEWAKENTVGTPSEADRIRYELYLELGDPVTGPINIGVPDAPFKQTSEWVSLSLKRIIAYAADKDFDAVSWTTGEVQRVRNDKAIADNVDEILVTRLDDDNYNVVGMRSGKSVGGPRTAHKSQLADYIGKDMAERAVAQLDEWAQDTDSLLSGTKEVSFRGDDLKVGGHGYKAFYDAPDKGRGGFVWNAANKIGKKFGVKVSDTDYDISGMFATSSALPESLRKNIKKQGYYGFESLPDMLLSVRLEGPEVLEKAGVPGDVIRGILKAEQSAKQLFPSLRLTDELKTSVKTKGQRLMQDEGGATPKGQVEFHEDGQTIIRGFGSSDVSTGIHEIAHVARRRLLNRDVPAEARAGISDEDILVAEKWAGAEGGKWSTAAEEKLARGFERYVRDGKAPKGLEGFFSKLAAWMREVYSEVTGSSLDVDVSPEMKAVFDKMMKRGDLPPVPKAGRGTSLFGGAPKPRVLHQAAEGPDEAVEAATKAADDYEARLVEEHGSVADAPRGKRGRLTGLRNAAARAADQSPYPEGATKPSEGFPINVDKASETPGVGKAMESDIRSGTPEHHAELETQHRTREELEADVRSDVQALHEAGIDGLDADDLAKYPPESLGVISRIVKRLRNDHQQLVHEASELADKMEGGARTDQDLMRFANLRGRAEDVRVRIKRYQEGAGRLLSDFGAKGQDNVPGRSAMPEEMLRADADPRIANDYLEELGGGDVQRGREMVEKDMARFQAIRKSQGEKAAIDHLADRAKWPHMLTEYWMNSILSGPITHLVNMTSNALNTLFLPLEQALGHAASLNVDGVKEAVGMYAHLWSQFTDAAKAASEAFKEGDFALDQVGKFDTDRPARALRSDNPHVDKLGALLNVPSRLLMSEDAFFKTLNYRAQVRRGLAEKGADLVKQGKMDRSQLGNFIETEMQKIIQDGQFYSYKNVREAAEKHANEAIAKSKHRGAKNEAQVRQRLINRYMNQNWKEEYSHLATKAREYGREVTYTQSINNPERAPLVQATGKLSRIMNDHPSLRLVAPFIRTPTNLITFFMNRTIGNWAEWAQYGLRQNQIRKMRKTNKEMAEELAAQGPDVADMKGRFLTGSLFMGGAFIAFNSGNITGGGPKDPEKRRMMEANGWQPYSIRVGDEWYSYRRLDPFANFLGIVADMGEAMREADKEGAVHLESLMGAMVYSTAKNIGSKTYLTGIASVANVIANPERYGDAYVERMFASFLPFSSAAGQTVGADEYQKDIRGILDAMRAKYGLTHEGVFDTEVAHRRNVLGDKIERPQAVMGVSPLHYTQIKDDEILEEFNQLGHGFGPPKHVVMGINTQEHHNHQGVAFYDRWQENHGKARLHGQTLKQALRRLIRSANYRNLPVDDGSGFESPRVAEIQKVIRKYRARALEQTLREFPEVERLYRRNQQIKQYRRAGRDIQSLLDY